MSKIFPQAAKKIDDSNVVNVSPDQVRALRIQNQYLQSQISHKDLIEVVRSLCGVNAQLTPAMMLSLRARIRGMELADVEKAIKQKRSLVRTWAMRGTIHLLAADDFGWIVSLLGPTIIAKSKRRYSELGLDEEKLAKGLDKIREILNNSEPLARGELINELIDKGVDIDQKSQAPYHMISHAGLKGLICMGQESQNGEQTYALVDNWVVKQKSLNVDQALAELACRYLRGYGPASPDDFASWSGLSLTDAKKGWQLVRDKEALREIKVENRILWMLETQFKSLNELTHTGTVVNLLPAFDTYILGYSDREYLVPGKYRKEVYHGGQTVPAVLVNGLASGVWRYGRQGKTLNIKIIPFESFDENIKALIEEEIEDIGRFFGLPVQVDFSKEE